MKTYRLHKPIEDYFFCPSGVCSILIELTMICIDWLLGYAQTTIYPGPWDSLYLIQKKDEKDHTQRIDLSCSRADFLWPYQMLGRDYEKYCYCVRIPFAALDHAAYAKTGCSLCIGKGIAPIPWSELK